MYKDLVFDKQEAVTRITLNRPEKHNALTVNLSDELHEAVRVVRRDDECRVMILTGAGGTFCAGDDITEFPTWTPDQAFRQVRLYQETAQMIEDIEGVTIAAVDGVCMGGGLELTLVCDFVIATDRSRWGMPEVDLGITPGWGVTSRLSRYVGRHMAKEINLIGAEFDAHRARDLSLVNRVVAPAELEVETRGLVDLMLGKSRHALRRTKFNLNRGADAPISAAMALEVPAAGFQEEEGVQSFVEKGEIWRQRRSAAQHFWQS